MSGFLGIVSDKKFQPQDTSFDGSARLTRISMVAGTSPESDEIDLTQYEGKAIMVEGTPSGEWIFDAEVVDVAGAILTEVVKKVFSQKVTI